MKEIAFKNMTSTKKRRKIVSLTERSERSGHEILSHKTLIYIVNPQTEAIRALDKPEYFVTKSYDSVTKEERFSLRTKGTSYLIQDKKLFRVDFCHSLRIDIRPLAVK